MALSSPVPKELYLTDAEVKSLQTAWRRARGSQDAEDADSRPGLHTFREIFMQMGEIRDVFGFKGYDDPKFVQHTIKFTDFLNKMIHALDNKQEFDSLCDKLGRYHARVPSMSFRPEYWDVFASSIIACALDETDFRTQDAWRNVIRHMIHRMKKGYHDELVSGSCPINE